MPQLALVLLEHLRDGSLVPLMKRIHLGVQFNRQEIRILGANIGHILVQIQYQKNFSKVFMPFIKLVSEVCEKNLLE